MAHYHNYHLVCQLFYYMIFNGAEFGITSTNNFSYFFKYSIINNTLYISDPISCTFNKQSNISIFKAMWYVLMLAEKSFQNQSEHENLKSHYQSFYIDLKNDKDDVPSTSTQKSKKRQPLENDNKTTKQTKFKLSSIKQMIGYGASGVVKLYEKLNNENIAIKIIDMAKNPKGFAQAKNELNIYEILFQLQGDYIPKIEFIWECYPFLIFGMTLIDKLEVGVMSMDQKQQLQIILDKIHDLKVTHNDLRFENIITDKNDKVWLIDFGKAKAHSSQDEIDDDVWQ